MSSAEGEDRTARQRRWIVALLWIALFAGALWIGARFELGGVDADALAERVRAEGALAPALLILFLMVQSVVAPLPSQPVLMAAGFVYGPVLGFAIAWTGVLAGACACFGLARALGRPFVERFASAKRIETVDAYVSQRGMRTAFFTVLSLRLFAHVSFDVVSYACGLIRFPFPWFALATGLGEVPKVLIFASLGASLGVAPGWMGLVAGAGLLVTVAVVWWISRRAGREAPARETS